MKKTGRIYGAIFNAIREVAQNYTRFTLDDVAVSQRQFNSAIVKLVKRGEVRRVCAGKNGRGFRRAVFAKL